MVFLPIAERELRVNARKRSMVWARGGGALAALTIFGIFYAIEASSGSFGPGNFGSVSFYVLVWLSLAAALGAGLFFTADALSEEKRDGTLGLLFLTDLRGYDVVMGKLLSASLQGFCSLLAIFPIVAVTFLLGGVTGGAFWKSTLALLNALIVSLLAGLFVSTLSRDSLKALTVTLLLLALWAGAGPAIDGILAASNKRPFTPAFSLASPGYVLAAAGSAGRMPYWSALAINQVMAWTLLGLTCALLPRKWQERERRDGDGHWGRWWRQRRRLVQVNPMVWLASLDRWQAIAAWGVALLLAGTLVVMFGSKKTWVWYIWAYAAGALRLLIYVAIAAQAARFFVELRRAGVLELLLATPLTVRQVVQGQWRACVRVFAIPMLLVFGTQALGAFMVQRETTRMMATAAAAGTGGSNTTVNTSTGPGGTTTVTVGGRGPSGWIIGTVAGVSALTGITSIIALIWFGMWTGLTERKSSVATLKTIGFVQVIPWLVISIGSTFIIPIFLFSKLSMSPGLAIIWYPLLSTLVPALFYLAKDFFFYRWSSRRLYAQFRDRAGGIEARTTKRVRRVVAPSATQGSVVTP